MYLDPTSPMLRKMDSGEEHLFNSIRTSTRANSGGGGNNEGAEQTTPSETTLLQEHISWPGKVRGRCYKAVLAFGFRASHVFKEKSMSRGASLLFCALGDELLASCLAPRLQSEGFVAHRFTLLFSSPLPHAFRCTRNWKERRSQNSQSLPSIHKAHSCVRLSPWSASGNRFTVRTGVRRPHKSHRPALAARRWGLPRVRTDNDALMTLPN